MDPKAMEPFGAALKDYFNGDSAAEMIFRRDDGLESRVPAGHFFREPGAFTSIENRAIELCTGHVLDVGAGTGPLSLALQQRGIRVTAIDIDPLAAEIMAKRGVKDVHAADFFHFAGGPYDTLLLMGHGIGMVETIAGLDRFLAFAAGRLFAGGQVIFDSLDVRVSRDPKNLSYHEANRRAGRYIGEVRMQIEYQGKRGSYCGWLQVDAETIGDRARRAEWTCEVIERSEDGDYLGRLTIG